MIQARWSESGNRNRKTFNQSALVFLKVLEFDQNGTKNVNFPRVSGLVGPPGHLSSERCGTSQTGPLWSRGAIEGKRSGHSGVRARCRHRVFDGEETGAPQEEGRFSNTLQIQTHLVFCF